ncbi:tRNA/tmRNA/rRNA uracil-C5-methylase, TrmA/RlmC/RlmD family [Paramicrobacterium humi]|uniref:tRNA/tmRNA/rRNA uracil-C5-methylase, TrmA/RlmC/RlmD family n=1 Tax=Paramicrobacterium humi TaxID=640635 RepID=A0A1H4IT85_9MICO|nr:TRAM domain-containing protein [Microbacterium humi]SEB37270.1 tRNA/tmRNA/rRNA uracil-C5-methylase, TrmA/RlmC/RlmD family [Microbacterium humi]
MAAHDSEQVLELDVTNVAHGGVFVARHEGRVVFVADAIPGEKVRARVTEAKKSFWRAETLEVLEASPQRREHVWEAASIDRDPDERAGGAEFGHIELAHQRELKRQVLAAALGRFGRIEPPAFTVEAMPGDDDARGTGWRTRVRLHVDDAGAVGPYAARSHRVIPVAELPLALPRLVKAAPLCARVSAASVDVVAPSTGDAFALAAGESRSPIVERVGDRDFTLEATGFWQVHKDAAATLSRAVKDAIDLARVAAEAPNLDLYGGVGLLAAAFGDAVGASARITSVEADRAATGHARENLAEWANASAETARVDRYLQRLVKTVDAAERRALRDATVVLDPPRSGAGTQVVAQLAELAPAQIVYVACDPVALSRDTGSLAEAGYALTGLRAFDLFPNTHHLEAVASFVPVARG